MNVQDLLNNLHLMERLKDATRHCYTSMGRHESVAEHSWRLALMAYWISDEFPGVDMNKVIRMCLIHDIGEAFTGDIPTFLKTDADESTEEALLFAWVETLPDPFRSEMRDLYHEMIVNRHPFLNSSLPRRKASDRKKSPPASVLYRSRSAMDVTLPSLQILSRS